MIVLAITGAALILFVTEWIAPDLVALLVLISLGAGGLLDLPTLFSGFGSPVIITLIGVLMMTSALQHTGVTAMLSQAVLRLTQGLGERALVGLLSLSAAVGSLMMNTVASAALIAPVGRRVALNREVSPSRLLMPIAFSALLGGMATLLTTSNLIVSALLAERGYPSFGLFDFLPVGGPIALVGIAYLTLAAPRLLPERAPADQWGGLQKARREMTQTYRLSMRLHEAYVRPDSRLAGKTLAESDLGRTYGVTVSAVVRGRKITAPPAPQFRVQAGDWLLLQGRPAETEAAARDLGVDLFDYDESDHAILFGASSELAEVALSPRTTLIGMTLRDIAFREKYGLNVLAIWHEGQPVRSYLSDYALSRGDALLVQGPVDRLEILGKDPNFLVLTHLPDVPHNTDRAIIAVLILFGFLVVAALNWLPIAIAALTGGISTVLTRCQSVEEARSSPQWQVIFLIGGMLPLARALEQTGAASFLVDALNAAMGGLGPRGLMMAFFLMTMVLAQFTSGQAASLIIVPLAISSAVQADLSPYPIVLAAAIGASTGFLSPISHPANLLIMSPGGYRFGDYPRLGFPLVLIASLGVLLLSPLAYPF
ncbi:MAG: SLC13 family permease [Anaerolineae bacterium]